MGDRQQGRIHHVRAGELDPDTAQTAGMRRAAAVAGATTGSTMLQAGPGDYVYVPPFVPHREENPSADLEAVVVIARTTQEAIVVNLPSLHP